jgi:hypothetical protein
MELHYSPSIKSDLYLTSAGSYIFTNPKWRFVRAFVLDMPETVKVGVHAQAPFAAGCRALFKSFELSEKPVNDFRSGE